MRAGGNAKEREEVYLVYFQFECGLNLAVENMIVHIKENELKGELDFNQHPPNTQPFQQKSSS